VHIEEAVLRAIAYKSLRNRKADTEYRNSRGWASSNPEVTKNGFRNTGASTQCCIRVLIGSRLPKEPKSATEDLQPKSRPPEGAPGPALPSTTQHNRNLPRDIERRLRDPVFTLPFPVNLWPARTCDSDMGGTASTGLGSTDHHGLRDVGFLAADDRPNYRAEDTNRKSLKPATENFTQRYKYCTMKLIIYRVKHINLQITCADNVCQIENLMQ